MKKIANAVVDIIKTELDEGMMMPSELLVFPILIAVTAVWIATMYW